MQWLPPLGVTSGLVAYAVVAIVMVVVEVFLLVELLPRQGPPPLLSRMVIGTSALLGSAAFLLALLDYLFFPGSDTATTELLWGLNFMMFVPPGLWVIGVIVFRDRTVNPAGWRWPVLIAVTATAAEVLMGLIFSVSSPVPLIDLGTVAQSVVSPWFDWSMAAAMGALLVWVPLRPGEHRVLATLVAAAVVAPWVAASPLLGAALMSITMGLALVIVYRRLVSRAGTGGPDPRLLLGVSGAFIVMAAAGWAYLALPGALGLLAFGLISMTVMAADLAYLAHRALARLPGPATTITPVPSGIDHAPSEGAARSP